MDLSIDNPPDGVDDDDNWDFNCAIGEESAQHAGMKWKLLDLQDECLTKKRIFLTNVAEAVESAQKTLRSADAPVYTVPSLEIPVTAAGDTTKLAAELDKAKVRIAQLESVEITTFVGTKSF